MPRAITPRELEAHLPHRGCNLIPDLVEVADGGLVATATVTVPPGDPRGREVFGRRDAAGAACWYEPFIFEFLALTGIPLLTPRLAPLGQVAVFSAISRISLSRLVKLGSQLTGRAEIVRDRAPFTVFACSATVDGQHVLDAEVMSGVSTLAEVSSRPAAPQALPPATALDAFGWKPRETTFVDAVASWDPAGRRIACTYAYPADHPFVPGHFPGAPLMMGVTQLAAVADAGWAALQRLGAAAGTVSGSVRRPDGAGICEVRDLVLADDGGVPRIAALKRIAFREPVRPGDTLIVEASIA